MLLYRINICSHLYHCSIWNNSNNNNSNNNKNNNNNNNNNKDRPQR